MQSLILGAVRENSPLQREAAVYHISLVEEKNFGGSLAVRSNVNTFQEELIPGCNVKSTPELQGCAPWRRRRVRGLTPKPTTSNAGFTP